MADENDQGEQGEAPTGAKFDLGKKVFFLYPPSVVKDEVVARLLEQEYEVYVLRDHVVARRVLRAYPDSIIFVNIDEGLSDKEWEKWIGEVLADPVTAGVGVGIVSYNADEALRQKFLMEVGARCGFVRLKLGTEESLRILSAMLQANEARGRRKYIRANCEGDTLTSINVRHPRGTFTGTIHDVSSVGFSCRLDPDPNFLKSTKLDDIQLKLHGVLLKIEGIVYGYRNDGGNVYVILFTPRMDSLSRSKVRKFIQISLQADIDKRANTL